MAGTEKLIVAEASYLLARGESAAHRSLVSLVRDIAEVMVARFGAFLILEVWAADDPPAPGLKLAPRAEFRMHLPRTIEFPATVDALRTGLEKVKTQKQSASVSAVAAATVCPPGMRPLFTTKELQTMGCDMVGLEVNPIYYRPRTGDTYPLLLRSLRRQIGVVLDRTFYAYSVERTTHQPPHYHALGRRAVVKAVWDVDRRLAAVSNSFDLLLQVTPVNADRSWHAFRRNRCQKVPAFVYRPRAVDPAGMKRALYDVPIERVEDPTLMHLFLGKQMELDRQLTLISDLGTRSFLYESMQLHGCPSPDLVRAARKILDETPARSRSSKNSGQLSAAEFARLAEQEIAWYAERYPEFKAKVQVSADMYSGLMVSRGRLLIGDDTRIPRFRAEALLQHEVGTHLLTYYNGQAQPFKMLYSGLPGYEELQEGLAVVAEYLAGGLAASRLRVLAARVVAADALVRGATFVDTFRLLDRSYDFAQRTAYTITMRIYRGGGLLKDAVYLRGLIGILKHLAEGNDFDLLFIGKIASVHVPVIEELLLRKVLTPPPLFPRYLEWADARAKLDDLRKGTTVLGLVQTK